MPEDRPQIPQPSVEDIIARYAAYEARAANLHLANKACLFEALSDVGIARIEMRFDGYGDSGQIEEINAWLPDDVPTDLPVTAVAIQRMDFGDAEPRTITEPLAEALDTLCYAMLATTHAGWENNAGAYGDFMFDVAAGTITLDYNERYESSEHHQHIF